MAASRTLSITGDVFVLSRENDNFSRHGQSYLGKLRYFSCAANSALSQHQQHNKQNTRKAQTSAKLNPVYIRSPDPAYGSG